MKKIILRRLLVLIACGTLFNVMAADVKTNVDTSVDTSKWKCKYCVVEEGWNADIELGFGFSTDDSFKFGEYNGLQDKGVHLIANGTATYRSKDASYLDLTISDLGLDTRSLDIEGGINGDFKYFFNFNEIPHNIADSTMTPYLGSGTTSLTLPGSWVQSGTTAGMSNLTASLTSVDLETKRSQIGAGVSYTPDSSWKYAVNYRQDTKEGKQRIAGSFFFSTVQLIQPIDYVTEQIDASIAFNSNDLQANLAYYGSVFSNSNSLLAWQNAYTPFIAGADSAQLALPPDNQFHQFMLSAGYNLNSFSRISGNIAIGTMEQNDALLAATQNANLTVTAPPAGSGTTEVGTQNIKLNLTSTPIEELRLSVLYTLDDRDNKTPSLTYGRATTDLFVATSRNNLPYSTKQNKLKLRADYKVDKNTKLGAGYNMETTNRTYQDIDKTTENTLWGSLKVRDIEKVNLELKLSQSDRTTSDFAVVAAIFPPQNVLLRKYNIADRLQNKAGLHLSFNSSPDTTIGFNVDFSKEDYNKSLIGLTSSNSLNLSSDINVVLSEHSNLNLFIARENIDSTQGGSSTFSSVDWTANNDDTFNNIGIGYTQVVIEDKLNIGIDYTRSNSVGKISYNNGATTPAFPNIESNLDRIKVFANYRLQKDMDLRVDYLYEHYTSLNWAYAYDGIFPNYISNALILGEQNPAYNLNAIMASIRYKF